jgi:hypothetical protein
MIGGINKRDLVNCLWYGCDKNIRTQLYLKNLYPELSSFSAVAEAAEIIELALLAVDTKQMASWKSESPRQ